MQNQRLTAENLKKDDKQTYVTFANQVGVYCGSWCSAAKPEPYYEERKQVVLIECFKLRIYLLKSYLDEQNVHEMAVLADD